jgi:hypothetical protein
VALTVAHGRLALAALPALASCVDFRIAAPPYAGLPYLQIAVSATHRDSTRYEAVARVEQGHNSLGGARPLRDTRIVVNGVALLPYDSTGYFYEYRWSTVRAADAPLAELAVRGPLPLGVEAATFVLPLLDREGGAIAAPVAAGDLALHVVPPSEPARLAVENASWSLELADEVVPGTAGLVRLRLDAVGVVPAEVRVPAASLAPLPPGPRLATLRTAATYRDAGLPHRVRAIVGARVEWRVSAP